MPNYAAIGSYLHEKPQSIGLIFAATCIKAYRYSVLYCGRSLPLQLCTATRPYTV